MGEVMDKEYKTMDERDLRIMPLHSTVELSVTLEVLRVAVGWVYTQYCYDDNDNTTATAVFVPEVLP